MTAGISVVARLKAKSGLEDELRGELLALVGKSRLDEGCINYDLHQSLDDRSIFVFYENWQSREHLDRHLATPHLQTFLGKAQELLASPVEISLLEMIS